MKVLQINSVCGVGSTGRIAAGLYQVLEKQGQECAVAYGRGRAPEEIKSIKIGSDFDVKMHGLFTRITDRHGFYSQKSTKDLIKKIEEFNPDVIHLHNIHGYYLNTEVLFDYLKSAQKPVIWTFHDCWPFTGHCSHFDYVVCYKWRTGCFCCPQKKEYPASLFADHSKENYDRKKELFTSVENMTIVTPSKWLAELAEQSFFQKYTVKVIQNGIDLNVFKPCDSDFREKNGLQDKFVILGVAGIWSIRKGLQFFIELSARLGRAFAIVIVGVTEKQRKNLPENILGITRTDNVRELTEIYSMADVFVNPTLEDNFPTTNLEALACGTPVITFDTGGSPESIDKTCGLVVEKGNVDALEAALRALKQNNFSQEACLARAGEFDMNKKFEDYLDLYQTKKTELKIDGIT